MNNSLQKKWDAIVIGAGPAGALSAFQLAKSGKKVILLDKVQFPRTKVCGCCINENAQRVLERAGLGKLLAESGAVPLNSVRLIDGEIFAEIKLSGGKALSRSYFDSALINAAVAEGVHFVSGAIARVLPDAEGFSRVSVLLKSTASEIEGRVVIVADGLNGHSLEQLPEFASVVASDSRFGCGTTFAPNSYETGLNSYYRPGTIYMACQLGGYVGLVVLEDGGIDVACALDRAFVRKQESLPKAVAAILGQCNLPLPVPAEQFFARLWQGTDSLTRRRPTIAGPQLFVVGDACGYPEPLTGEGIAWALESSEAVLPLALSAMDDWSDALARDWQKIHGRLVHLRQRKSGAIAYSLRNRFARRAAIKVLSSFPSFAESIAASLTQKVKQSAVSK
ncbi:hypothetical protein BH11CYA1_BH11CYA1_27300 [soil metagenome]